jgi:hypothetical protein
MNPMPKLPDELYLLQLEGTLYGTLMARNLFKSNVTWSSYPFLPPTSASGFLTTLMEGERWIEGNSLDLQPRTLHHLSGWEDVWVLGAFPSLGHLSRKHFRSHLGSIYNYEAALWSAGQNEGKKLAVVEEFWTDGLTFFVVSPDQARLEKLRVLVRGKVGPVAKKGCLAIAFDNGRRMVSLRAGLAQGNESVLGLIPVEEVGQMPLNAQLHRVPVSSQIEDKVMVWQTVNCLWAITQGTRFREGVPVFQTDNQAISRQLLQWASQ